MRIGVAATAPLGADVLERLAGQPRRRVPAHATRPSARPWPEGRELRPRKRSPSGSGIEVRQPEKLDESVELGDVDAMVVAAYGALIPESLLERALWLNVHPSLLPRWRGAAPVERAIMAGDTETGVTIHRTTAELDAGPISAQERFAIEPDDDAGAVYAKVGPLAAELLEPALQGTATFEPQPEEGATYAERLTRGRPRARLEPAVGGEPEQDPRPVAAHRRARSRGRPSADRLASAPRRRRARGRRPGAPGGSARGAQADERRRVPARPANLSA